MKHNFTQTQIEEIKKWYEVDKLSTYQISQKLNIPDGSIIYLFKKFNIKTRSNNEANKLHFTLDIPKEKLVELYINQHKSIKQIAEEFKVSTATIFKKLKKFGIPTKKAHATYKVWTTKPEWNWLVKKNAKITSPFVKGHTPWNKGLTKDTDKRVEETGKKIKEAHDRGCFDHVNYVHPKSEETRRKLSLAHGGNGVPYSDCEYSFEFLFYIRQDVKKRDKFTCQMCGKTHAEIKGDLHVHHIDYNKKNDDLNNLITLCGHCHQKTNYNRPSWIEYFKNKELYAN